MLAALLLALLAAPVDHSPWDALLKAHVTETGLVDYDAFARSAEFRSFLRDELMPFIDARYPTSGETAIVGESLAGLFAVECFLLEPGLFDTVIAIDPSLWWNRGDLVARAGALLRAQPWRRSSTLWLASSDEGGIAAPVATLAESLSVYTGGGDSPGLHWLHRPLPGERHLTIYHPAALQAFREVLGER